MGTEADRVFDEAMRAVELLSDAFARRSIRYALIDGLANSMRGRPMATQDVGFLVDVPAIILPALLDDLLERGFSFDHTTVIKEYTQEYFTFISFSAARIDWLKPVLPFYSRALLDAEALVWSEGHPIRVATTEGLILTKMVAFRPQDQIDIDMLLTANRDTIDVESIRTQWSIFADSEVERTAWLEAAIGKRIVRRE